MNITAFHINRTQLIGIAAVCALAIGALAAIIVAQQGDDAGAGNVEVVIQGVDGPQSLGAFSPEEAIDRGQAEAGFTFRLPRSLPDDRLELNGIAIYQNPATGDTHRVGLSYWGVGDADAADTHLSVTLFAPGEQLGFGGPEDAEQVEIGDSTVHIVTQEGGLGAQQFAVIDDQLPMDITSAGIPREAVLSMIEEMLGA